MFKILAMLGAGAGAAYLMDKEKGAARREQLRVQMEQALQKLDQTSAIDAQDQSSPVSGIIRGARTLVSKNRNQAY